MIKTYFLITLRGLTKNKLFIIINVFGMGIAIAISIVTFLAFEYDQTFDAVHKNGENVYRVSALRVFENQTSRIGYVPLPLGEITDKTIPDIGGSTRYVPSNSNFKREDDLFPSNLAYVDPQFFQLFSWEFIEGKADDLKDKTSVFISEDMAIRLFQSSEKAYGKTITQVIGTELKEVKVAGVFKEPVPNSSFYKRDGSAYMNFENYKDEFSRDAESDWKTETTLFVEIADASRVASVQQQLQPYKENNNKVREDFQVKEFVLDRFATMAHCDRDAEARTWTWGAPPAAAITGSMIMAVLLLLIACFNLTNTAIAISSRRLKEIGIRKVMGSMRIQLIIQFIGETTFICFVALIVALGLTDGLIEGWNLMTGNNIFITSHYLDAPAFLFFLVGVLLFTGVLAGSYPAFYISKFEPVNILKGKLKFGGTNYFTRTLLGLQFSFSLIAIVSSIAFLQNARYQKDYDLGFDARGSVVVSVNNQEEFETYRNALQSNPEIESIAGAESGIFSNRAHEPVKFESLQSEVDVIGVGDNYLITLDLKLLDGRDFIKDSETDLKESIIITQKMTTLFGWENPLGKQIIWKDSLKLFVVGVVRDVYTDGLWKELKPMMIRYVKPTHYNQLVVSTKAENISSVNEFMRSQWNEVFPNRLYNGNLLGSALQEVADLNMGIMYGYAFLGAIALLLSLTGLYTLVSLNIIKRMKEIGVRKVLGASIFNISRIVNMEFFIIVGIASILGSWMGYTWCSVLMGTIWKYYQGVNVFTFVAAVGGLLFVSLLTIGFKVFAVSNMDPVKTLRDE